MTMKRLISIATLAVCCAGIVNAAAASGSGASRSEARECSAARVAAPAAQALPPRVASMLARIVWAARRCDYAALVRLGNERGRGLTFSYGGRSSAPAFWRTLERNGPRPRPMEALVKLLSMPAATVAASGKTVPAVRARLYVWPRAHRAEANDADWRALRALYPAAQLERMRRGGTGYVGYRIGITPAGDWQFFVAGD